MPNTNPNFAEELKRELASVRSDVSSLMEKVKLNSIRDSYSRLDLEIENLPTRISKIRDRKFAFNKILENQGAEFRRQWMQKKNAISIQLNNESRTLSNSVIPLERRAAALNTLPNPLGAAKALKEEVTIFESRISATERAIKEMFDDLENEVSKVKTQLSLIEKTLEYSESASFGFLPAEGVIRAVKAVWTRDNREDKQDPEGILFLTDQRLLFEQREEVATKKVLFLTKEREKIQQLLFEVPVFSVKEIKAEKQGVFKDEDWLKIELEHGAFSREAALHIDGQNCEEWQRLLIAAKNRELDTDRAIPLDLAAVEKARSAPEKCPNCGGSITRPVLRGMDSIICDFCGNRINL